MTYGVTINDKSLLSNLKEYRDAGGHKIGSVFLSHQLKCTNKTKAEEVRKLLDYTFLCSEK